MKQYLLMCNEEFINKMGSVFQGLHFLEVQGMTMATHAGFNVLVSPVIPPVPLASIEQGVSKVSEEIKIPS